MVGASRDISMATEINLRLAFGTKRHFAAAQQSVVFGGKADIGSTF
jgi:hypothetical protein